MKDQLIEKSIRIRETEIFIGNKNINVEEPYTWNFFGRVYADPFSRQTKEFLDGVVA